MAFIARIVGRETDTNSETDEQKNQSVAFAGRLLLVWSNGTTGRREDESPLLGGDDAEPWRRGGCQ